MPIWRYGRRRCDCLQDNTDLTDLAGSILNSAARDNNKRDYDCDDCSISQVW